MFVLLSTLYIDVAATCLIVPVLGDTRQSSAHRVLVWTGALSSPPAPDQEAELIGIMDNSLSRLIARNHTTDKIRPCLSRSRHLLLFRRRSGRRMRDKSGHYTHKVNLTEEL